MKFSFVYKIFQNHALLWLVITILVWWTGLAGRDLYLFPSLIFFGIINYQLYKNQNYFLTSNWMKNYFTKHLLIILFFVHVVLYLVITILKYYSFSWNVWDVGSFSNILYNISQGRFYSSYLGVHNWADHFSPSMSPLALFYFLIPSTIWLTLSKTIAYLSVPFLIYKICQESFENKEQAWIITVILGLAWMLFYSPALNSFYYEFQPSALAPPFILYAFLCFQQKNKLRFWLTMIFLLGLKEHLGAVWIGFGLFMVLTTSSKKMGFLLIGMGIFSIYMIMFQIMPFFRNYEESWSMVLGPFQDIPGKLFYLFKILIPLGFLPLIFWRSGIIAGPAIGVNLLSSDLRSQMYSTNYHYDDIAATLLMIAMVLIFSSKISKFTFWKYKKYNQFLLAGWIVCVLGFLPSSPMRKLYEVIPNKLHWDIRKELLNFDQLSKDNSIAVQTSLGPQLHRRNILAITQNQNGECWAMQRGIQNFDTEYLVFSRSLNHYLIEDLGKCLKKLNQSTNYQRLSSFNHLVVFKKK